MKLVLAAIVALLISPVAHAAVVNLNQFGESLQPSPLKIGDFTATTDAGGQFAIDFSGSANDWILTTDSFIAGPDYSLGSSGFTISFPYRVNLSLDMWGPYRLDLAGDQFAVTPYGDGVRSVLTAHGDSIDFISTGQGFGISDVNYAPNPEPASLGLLLLAAPLAMRRRR